MSDIALHIDYLLTRHDCVVVPGWGAFLAQYVSANFVGEGCNRPRRLVTFNPDITHNDGLLQNSLIRREDISYESANREITDFVASMRKQMEYDGVVALNRIGVFKKNDETIVFEPQKAMRVCDNSYGLIDLRIKTLSQMTSVQIVNDEYEVSEKTNIIRLYGRRFAKYAAMIISLIGLCFILTTPLSFEKSIDYAGLDSMVKVKSIPQHVKLCEDGDLTIALPKCAKQEAEVVIQDVQNTEPEKNIDRTEIPHDEDGEYYLIVSSLDSMQQAEKFISRQQRNDLSILERNDRYRVYVAQSRSMKDLNKARRSLSSEFPDAWILK